MTQETVDFGAKMAVMAETHVDTSKERLGVDYDYSGQSLQVVDQALAFFHPDGFSFDAMMHVYGAYVGEAIRREHGGNWFQESDGTGASLRGVEGKATVYPLLWTAQRVEALKSGTGGSEIASQYAALLESLDLASKIPAAIPADFVQNIKGGNLFGGGTEGDDDIPVAELAGEEKKELSAEEKAESLAMSPACCFFLVSAVDGKIDKKEVKAFSKFIAEHASHPNALIQSVFKDAQANLEKDVAKISELGAGAILMLPIKLMNARVAAEETVPESAAEFCQALYTMSEKIASASGGFLGLSKKIGKEEEAALRLIETMLIGSRENG